MNSAYYSAMASEREIVSLTPPSFLTTLDWNNSHHKRSVAASLVQGVYTLEHDRRKGRNGPQSLAPPWWRSYNFNLVQILDDSHDDSHSGAVYEYLDFRHHLNTNQRPPRYVIAFRGTISKTGNWKQDFKLNLNLIINNLHNRSRFRIGIDAVRGFVRQAGPANVWIAGHSLGASLALLAGREMVKYDGVHLEAYLFNPPFPSLPIQRLTNDKLRLGLRLANSVLTAGLAAAVRNKIKEDDHFSVLSSWTPYLFINPSDPICSEYSGYFEHREDMEAIGAGRIGRIATKHSIWSVLLSAAGKECEAAHLIPSAYLTVNVNTPSSDVWEAHGIHQWWRQDLVLDCKYYQHK